MTLARAQLVPAVSLSEIWLWLTSGYAIREESVSVSDGRYEIDVSASRKCFPTAKNEVGLDHYQARRYDAWYQHTTLVMVAHPYLAVTAPTPRRGSETRSPEPDQPAEYADVPAGRRQRPAVRR